MAELVVPRFLVRIAQYLIGLCRFAEHFFRICVTGILVRMVFQGPFSIGLFYFRCGGIFSDAQYVVIIFLHLYRLVVDLQSAVFWAFTFRPRLLDGG